MKMGGTYNAKWSILLGCLGGVPFILQAGLQALRHPHKYSHPL